MDDEIKAVYEAGGEKVEETVKSFTRVSDERYQGLAAEKGYDQSYSRLQRTHYSHEAMIDLIVAEPTISQNELAGKFGYSVPWISRVIGSDAFQGALAKRREEITDPFLIATVEERLRGLATQALDVIAEKMQATQSADIALKALDISVKALGFGARERNSGQVQNNFIVQMPGKAVSAESWAEAYGASRTSSPKPANFPVVIDVLPISSTITRDPTIQPSSMTLAENR